MTTPTPVEKNVEAQLMKNKKVRRKPGDVPYPLEYSNCILNFDIWDYMFFTNCCRSLTMYQFDTPPAVVLDLGCGGGFWVMEAAKHWTTSTIIGFDLQDIQPKLHKFEHHRDLARRINWVHGNLLDGLPFPSHHFDFVRIVGIGLGVPEDEWQNVLEEVSRVMKSGAVLEIIEEDLIFPSAQIYSRPLRRPRPPPITVDLPLSESMPSSAYSNKSSATLLSDPWNTAFEERFDLSSSKSTYSLKSITPPSLSPQSLHGTHSSVASSHSPPIVRPEPYDTPDPRDHSRLKSAWESMLSRRFLAANLLAVLPFYLSSSFIDVQTHPSLKVPLPPSSDLDQSLTQWRSGESISLQNWVDPDVLFNLKPSSSGISTSSDHSSIRSIDSQPSYNMPPRATMHLAKTVKTVKACKEAIWEEYEQLYSADPMPLVTRTARPEGVRAQSSKPSSRETFDMDWSRWENDMADRIGMRNAIVSQLAWTEPPGERPDWRIWRANVDKITSPASSSSSILSDSQRSTDLCRSLRGFVGRKP